LFVRGFLGVFLLAGLIGLEAWPLTGWKMYSRLRHGEYWAWQVLAVGPDGDERYVELRDLPTAYHGVAYFLGDLAARSAEDQEAACLALGEAARTQYPEVVGVVVDRIRGRVPTDPDDPPSGPSGRIRTYQCRLG
jgi:hypothetical protein